MATTDSNSPCWCYNCSANLIISGKVMRRDTCPKCGVSLHSCRFCKFYDPKHYNQCKETSAERVLDKEKENYCDYFVFNCNQVASASDTEKIKSKLNDLFK